MEHRGLVAKLAEILGLEARQRYKPRTFDVLARVFVRFADIDEDGAALVEALSSTTPDRLI